MDRKKKTQLQLIEDLQEIALEDVESLTHSQESYGDSWKKRGGVGAFMMLARKWDRIENQVKKHNFDIFETIYADPSNEGIIDDIWDLRRYLILVEAEVRAELGGFPPDAPPAPQDKKSEGSGNTPLGTLSTGNRLGLKPAD